MNVLTCLTESPIMKLSKPLTSRTNPFKSNEIFVYNDKISTSYDCKLYTRNKNMLRYTFEFA